MQSGHNEAAILCLENRHSAFAASEQLFHSGIYELVVATTTASALIALTAIPRISAAVLCRGAIALEKHVEVAAAMDAVRPGVPKLVVALRPRIYAPEKLNVAYIHSLEALNEELQRMVASSRMQLRQTEFVAQVTTAQSECVREETKRLREQAEREIRAWQYERRLVFTASEKWTGWCCERCCWNIPAHVAEDPQKLIWAISEAFAQHDCEKFARMNWPKT